MLLDGLDHFRLVTEHSVVFSWRLREDEDALGKGDLVSERLHGDGGREVVKEGVVRKTIVGSLIILNGQ